MIKGYTWITNLFTFTWNNSIYRHNSYAIVYKTFARSYPLLFIFFIYILFISFFYFRFRISLWNRVVTSIFIILFVFNILSSCLHQWLITWKYQLPPEIGKKYLEKIWRKILHNEVLSRVHLHTWTSCHMIVITKYCMKYGLMFIICSDCVFHAGRVCHV